MPFLRIPTSTYRLQFNHLFTFNQALKLLDYLEALGVSDLYSSPIMKAVPGSMHGYDVLDPNQINSEIGSEEDLIHLTSNLKKRGMGFLLDTVPNHMCISYANKWFDDVLENGIDSIYVDYFYIDWNPLDPKYAGKVILPVLDKELNEVLENQEIELICEKGCLFLKYKQRCFPLSLSTWTQVLKPLSGYDLKLKKWINEINELPKPIHSSIKDRKERHHKKEQLKTAFAALLKENPQLNLNLKEELTHWVGKKLAPLLDLQPYHFIFWGSKTEEINYKRFFTINDLITVHIELKEVFFEFQKYLFNLVQRHVITGLRIDHVDGLYDPAQYFEKLQQTCYERLAKDKIHDYETSFYTVVEKILIGKEKLRENWLVHGTTGYDCLNILNGLFIEESAKKEMKDVYERFTDMHSNFQDVIYQSKKFVLSESFLPDLHILTKYFIRIYEPDIELCNFDVICTALAEILACFPVYRTYIRFDDEHVSEDDKKYLSLSITKAKKKNRTIPHSIFEGIQKVLLLQDKGLTTEDIKRRRAFVLYFQQVTGPVMAKGVEDTAFYRYYPLVSLNEVGMDSTSFGTSKECFDCMCEEINQHWPHTLSGTFTHDTKRSEDVRARLNVLSEDPQGWQEALNRWATLNRDKKIKIGELDVPSPNEEYLLYQTLVGSWPLEALDDIALLAYKVRIENYMIKALKEAKIHTAWMFPNEEYEKAIKSFIHSILSEKKENRFLDDFKQYLKPLIRPGLLNSLVQTIVKMTAPGVPDFYQGSELWVFTLVDPDNRDQVDYSVRIKMLDSLRKRHKENPSQLLSELISQPEDGRIKLYLISKVLKFRKEQAALFREGSYFPIHISGNNAKHIIGFGREYDGKIVLIIVGRFFYKPIEWNQTFTVSTGGTYKDILTDVVFKWGNGERVSIAELFVNAPFSILIRI